MADIKKEVKNDLLTLLKDKIKLTPPSMYNVLLHNDDFTPMDFVVEVLQKFFDLDTDVANRIMLNIHYKNTAICGIYTAEIAETKVQQVLNYSRNNEYPLLCSFDKAE